MQINNVNGSVIRIDQIYVDRNRVDYSLYEYGGSAITTRKSHPFSTLTLADYLNVDTNFENLCYDTLIVEIDANYAVSEDLTNWVIPTGSTGEDTTLRVYIPTKIIGTVLHTGNALDQLLKAMEPLSPQVVRLANGSHQYLIVLEDAHKAILEAYPEIVIEEKLVWQI